MVPSHDGYLVMLCADTFRLAHLPGERSMWASTQATQSQEQGRASSILLQTMPLAAPTIMVVDGCGNSEGVLAAAQSLAT
eukprot:1017-Eustigmatos_ZCMA.PRE.1